MYDMAAEVNGTRVNGAGVLPFAPKYDMRVESLVDVDLITITSCHRDFHQEAAIKKSWFQDRRGYEYVYRPSPGLEDRGSCLLRLGAYTKDAGQAAWAVLDFQTPDATLPALNLCNGEVIGSAGVSVCQSRAGLIQRLVFDTAVRFSAKADPRCVMADVNNDQKTWEGALSTGECVILFQEVARPNRIHRHTTVGYTEILIRGK